MSIRKIVIDNLDTALEDNDYFGEMDQLTAEDLTHDLLRYGQDCEDLTFDQIAPHAQHWIDKRSIQKRSRI